MKEFPLQPMIQRQQPDRHQHRQQQ